MTAREYARRECAYHFRCDVEEIILAGWIQEAKRPLPWRRDSFGFIAAQAYSEDQDPMGTEADIG